MNQSAFEKVKAAFREVFGGAGDSRFTRYEIRAVTSDAVYAERSGGSLPRVFQKFGYEPSGRTFMFSLPVEVSEAVVTAAAAAQGAFSVVAAPAKSRPRGFLSVLSRGEKP